MSRPIPAGDYVEHFDPELAHHRAWLEAVLERLITHEPQALQEGGTLRMCFSSSCAMLLAFLKPGVLTGSNGDDQ